MQWVAWWVISPIHWWLDVFPKLALMEHPFLQDQKKPIVLGKHLLGAGAWHLPDSKVIGKPVWLFTSLKEITIQLGFVTTVWHPGFPTSHLEISEWKHVASTIDSPMRSTWSCKGTNKVPGNAWRVGQKIETLKTLLWNSFYAVLFPGCFLFYVSLKMKPCWLQKPLHCP